MKVAKSTVALVVICASFCSAQGGDQTDVVFYAGQLDYGNASLKDTGNVFGLYVSTGVWGLEIDSLDIDYRNGTSLRQTDFTAVHSTTSRSGNTYRLGGHYLDSDDAMTDGGWTLITGIHRDLGDGRDAGLDAYVSDYNNLKARQVSPHFGMTTASDAGGSTRVDLTGNYIKLDRDVGWGRRSFSSLEGRWSRTSGPWTYSGFGWMGSQAFAVRNGGFLVYNLTEKHTGGWGAEVRYVLSPTAAVTARVSRERFEDLGAATGTSAMTYMLLYGRTF